VPSDLGPVAVEKRGKKKNEGIKRMGERHHMPKPFVDLSFHEASFSSSLSQVYGGLYQCF